MRRNPVVAAMAAALLLGSCSGCAVAKADDAHSAADNRAAKASKATASATAQSLSTAAQRALTTAMTPVAKSDGHEVEVSVDDLTTGAQASYDSTVTFVTASIVKVDILATLLLQAQNTGQSLSSAEQSLATTMIENSNDTAASDLYDDAGGAAAIDQANDAFGLTDTTVGTAGYWGDTTTTTADQIKLLKVVFTEPSPLTTASQDYIKTLMSNVEADQQWGVPAAADSGTTFWVKNGWLPRTATGLWEINSIGEITHDGQRMLISVLSAGNETEDGGISVVQAAAKAAADAAASART